MLAWVAVTLTTVAVVMVLFAFMAAVSCTSAGVRVASAKQVHQNLRPISPRPVPPKPMYPHPVVTRDSLIRAWSTYNRHSQDYTDDNSLAPILQHILKVHNL